MSIIKRKAGSEDIVKSILEFDEVPTEGSPNLVDSGTVFEAISEGDNVAVFEAGGVPVTGYPTYAQVGAALDAGKWPVIKVSTTGNVSFYAMTSSFTSAHYKFIECDGHGSNTITINSDDSVVLESQGPSLMVFTGTYNPAASPADFSGMPNTLDIAAALDAGRDVVLMLADPSNVNTVTCYRLVTHQQYVNFFSAVANGTDVGGWKYLPGLVMAYGGPGNPWSWSPYHYLSQELRTSIITESDIFTGHCSVNNFNSLTTMTLTSVNSVTMHTNDYTAVNNFCVQIDNTGNSNDVTIDVQHGPDSLKYSVAGGNVVGAGKYMQLTCVGSCWTLAEFTVPTP